MRKAPPVSHFKTMPPSSLVTRLPPACSRRRFLSRFGVPVCQDGDSLFELFDPPTIPTLPATALTPSSVQQRRASSGDGEGSHLMLTPEG